MRILAALLCLLLAAPPLGAQVYRSVDKNGNVVYSDTPGPDSERVILPPVQTYTPAPLPASPAGSATAKGDAEAVPAYRVTLISPTQDATVRENSGTVNVSVQVEPPLRDGHQVRVLLDGSPAAGPAAATGFVLQFVPRGTHTVSAQVLDASGKTLASSQAVTFHLHRFFRKPNP